ncbi:MAG TPA: hypothetical protein VGD98_05575 [Ktedonobacteraceae bacterium]
MLPLLYKEASVARPSNDLPPTSTVTTRDCYVNGLTSIQAIKVKQDS